MEDSDDFANSCLYGFPDCTTDWLCESGLDCLTSYDPFSSSQTGGTLAFTSSAPEVNLQLEPADGPISSKYPGFSFPPGSRVEQTEQLLGISGDGSGVLEIIGNVGPIQSTRASPLDQNAGDAGISGNTWNTSMNKSDSLDKQEIVIHGDNRMLEKLRGAVGQQIQPRIPEADITQYATGLDAVRVLMEAIFGPEKTPSREYLARIHQGEQFRIRYNGRGNPYWSSQIGSDRILSKEELQVIVQIVGDDLLPPLPLHLGVIWPEPLTSTEPDDRGVTHYSASTLGPGSPYGRTIWILFDKIDRSVDDSPCGWLGLVPFTGSGDGPPELPYTSLLNLGKSSIDAEGDLGPEFGPRWREDGVYSRFNGCQNPMPVQNQHADTDRLANSLQHPVPGTPERHVPHMGDPISPPIDPRLLDMDTNNRSEDEPSENRETRNRGTRNRGTRNPRIERGYPCPHSLCQSKSKAFDLKSQLSRHLREIHSPKDERKYKCTVPRGCKTKFISNSWSDYKRHLNVHNGTQFTCKNCQQTISRKDNLKRHTEDSCKGRKSEDAP